MDLRKLKTLIELVETSGIAELEIQEGEERVRITRSHGSNLSPLAAGQPILAVAAAPATGVAGSIPACRAGPSRARVRRRACRLPRRCGRHPPARPGPTSPWASSDDTRKAVLNSPGSACAKRR